MKNIKVSVIIYVKNTIRYIEKCIRSVREQTLQDIEILIIDGGSTDGTLDVVEKMRQEDHRIRVFQTAASVGLQFNLGLREARGQYIGVCEADDYILPEMYEKQYRIAEENKLDVLRAGYYQIFNIEDQEYRYKQESCSQDEMKEKLLVYSKDMFFLEQGIHGFWNGLYRRQFLLENSLWMNETNGAAYQDISFSFLTQMYAERIWFMKEAFYCYRMDNPNASVHSLHGVTLHIREYEELKKRLKGSNQWPRYKDLFYSWELMSYRWFLGELPNDQRMVNAQTVYQHLKKQAEEEKYNVENVMGTVKNLAKALWNSESEFVWSIVSGMENSQDLLRYVENLLPHEQTVILFGAGHMGEILEQFFALCDKEVLWMDNSEYLQKSGRRGKTVYRPEDLAAQYPDGRYIIAAMGHGIEMKEQLFRLGIRDEQILICDNEEFFLRNIFARGKQQVEK